MGDLRFVEFEQAIVSYDPAETDPQWAREIYDAFGDAETLGPAAARSLGLPASTYTLPLALLEAGFTTC